MLSSSHPKIHEPPVIGVSPRRTDQRQHQKLRNTRCPVGAENRVTASDQRFRCQPTSQTRLEGPAAGWLVARHAALAG
jgi:hypothetical protein